MNRQFVLRARVPLRGELGEVVNVRSGGVPFALRLRQVAASLNPESHVALFWEGYTITEQVRLAALEKLKFDYFIPVGSHLYALVVSTGETDEQDILFLCDVEE